MTTTETHRINGANPTFPSVARKPESAKELTSGEKCIKNLEEHGYPQVIKISEDEWYTFCPIHESDGEHDPALHVNVWPDRVVVHCFKCTDTDIYYEIVRNNIRSCTAKYRPKVVEYGSNGRKWSTRSDNLIPLLAVRDSYSYLTWCSQQAEKGDNTKWMESAQYPFDGGNVIKIKFEHPLAGIKTFLIYEKYGDEFRRSRGKASERMGLYGAEKYKTGINGGDLYIAQGEKDTETLWKLGLNAVGYNLGAKLTTAQLSFLSRYSLYVLQDNDGAGRKAAEKFIEQVQGVRPVSVRLMAPFDIGPKADVTDWAESLRAGELATLDPVARADEIRARLVDKATELLYTRPEGEEPAAEDEESTEDTDDNIGTWGEIDLSRYLENPVIPPPTVLSRTDGPCLLYPGHKAWVYGEPGSAKTWLAAYACMQEIKKHRHVVWFDFEAQGDAAVARLVTLGCTPDELREFFHLSEPEIPYTVKESRHKLDGLLSYRPAVVVYDAANGVLTIQGGKLNDPESIMRLDTMLLVPFCRVGSAVLVVDHVAKNADSRGLWPINSGQKKAVCSVAYSLATRIQFAPEDKKLNRPARDGASAVTVTKDRPGRAPAPVEHVAAYLTFRGGTFALEKDLDMGTLSAETASNDALVRLTVGESPGTYTTNSLAAELAARPGGVSQSTWNRLIKGMANDRHLAVSARKRLSLPEGGDE